MKEILRIIGKALTDISEVLPDRADPSTRWKEAKKKVMSEIHSGKDTVNPMDTVKPKVTEGTTILTDKGPVLVETMTGMDTPITVPPVGEFKDDLSVVTGTSLNIQTGAMNECVETGELLAPPVPPVQTAPTELDSEGIPWDKRIHSSGKTKYKQTVGDKKEGSWIHKKGVDPILLAQVKTELYQKYHTVEPVVNQFQSVQATQTAPPVADATVPSNGPGYLTTPTNQTPIQQDLPLPTAPGTLPPYGSITKWAPLMREAAGAGINHVAADGILAAAGLPTIAALQNTPSSIPAAALALGLTREV